VRRDVETRTELFADFGWSCIQIDLRGAAKPIERDAIAVSSVQPRLFVLDAVASVHVSIAQTSAQAGASVCSSNNGSRICEHVRPVI